ncbi:MAG: hypothetical protein P8J45_12685 [Phycisphaerales bacterium]|jgi:hypothetical protein|nr:hypothetical protein [Phycisphaerales bacterium]
MSREADHNCHCWIPVIAALLIVVSLSDGGLAIVLGSFADVVHEIRGEVSERSNEMRVAGFFSKITGGLVHLGDSQVGKAVQKVADELPPLWMMSTLAWGRVVLSSLGVLFGFLLAWRVRGIAVSLVVWGLISVLWGLLSVFEARVIFQALVIEDLMLTGVVLSCLALFLHFLWPLFIAVRLFKGIRAGDFAQD